MNVSSVNVCIHLSSIPFRSHPYSLLPSNISDENKTCKEGHTELVGFLLQDLKIQAKEDLWGEAIFSIDKLIEIVHKEKADRLSGR